MIAALFVEVKGVYAGRSDIDLWDEDRDAREYQGPHRAICHSPCARWGRFAKGQPGVGGKLPGNDKGCFYHALWSVRTFGGVLEHPAWSGAWEYFGLPTPGLGGWWGASDSYGGSSCAVDQGHYGYPAPKSTWLYACGVQPRDFIWGPSNHPGRVEKMSALARKQTTPDFRDALMELVSS